FSRPREYARDCAGHRSAACVGRAGNASSSFRKAFLQPETISDYLYLRRQSPFYVKRRHLVKSDGKNQTNRSRKENNDSRRKPCRQLRSARLFAQIEPYGLWSHAACRSRGRQASMGTAARCRGSD